MSNRKAKPSIPKLEPHQRKKKPVVFVKKPSASKCTVNVSPRENYVLPNAPATGAITMKIAKVLSKRQNNPSNKKINLDQKASRSSRDAIVRNHNARKNIASVLMPELHVVHSASANNVPIMMSHAPIRA